MATNDSCRDISDRFFNSLKSGLLAPFVERVKRDDTLMFAPRGEAFNIYYRGGNLLRVTARGMSEEYKAFFDRRYDKIGGQVPELPNVLRNGEDVDRWILAFPTLKNVMDVYFSMNRKSEREFQQLVARENNQSPISNETEYFIADIEYTIGTVGARIDMLGVKWSTRRRQRGDGCKLALIEMKFGDQVLSGSAGIAKHLDDFEKILKDSKKYEKLRNAAELQFNCLSELDLLNYNRSKHNQSIRISDEKPEVVFLLANHNPRSRKLKQILIDFERKDADGRYTCSDYFDLKFFVASFAGYGMHDTLMLSFDDFKKRI